MIRNQPKFIILLEPSACPIPPSNLLRSSLLTLPCPCSGQELNEALLKLFHSILLTLIGFILSLCSFGNLAAQPQQPSPIALNEFKPTPIQNFTYYVDANGKLEVGDVLRADIQNQFTPFLNEPLARGYTGAHYWLSVVIRNPTDQETWYLAADHPLLQATVYRVQAPGSAVQAAALDERYAISRLQLLPQQEAHLLIKATSRATLSLQFRFMTESQLARELHREALLLAVIAGCFLAMILYNLFLYLSLRDRDYLYYLFFAVINCHLDLLTVNFPAGIWTWFDIPW